MLTIKGLSDKPCFICNKTELCVELMFDDKTFRGVLCLSHMHQKLKSKEVPRAESGTGGRAA